MKEWGISSSSSPFTGSRLKIIFFVCLFFCSGLPGPFEVNNV